MTVANASPPTPWGRFSILTPALAMSIRWGLGLLFVLAPAAVLGSQSPSGLVTPGDLYDIAPLADYSRVKLWGPQNAGLQIGLSCEGSTVGGKRDIVLYLGFRNISNEPVDMYVDPYSDQMNYDVAVTRDDGTPLKEVLRGAPYHDQHGLTQPHLVLEPGSIIVSRQTAGRSHVIPYSGVVKIVASRHISFYDRSAPSLTLVSPTCSA